MSVVVVIPAHNEEKFIANCLKSLKKQTTQPQTIVVVADGCTDNTEQIASNFAKVLSVSHSQGYGFGYAKLLRIGKEWFENHLYSYDYLMVLDADQRLSKNYIKHCICAFNHNVAIVGGITHGIHNTFPRGAHRLLSKEFLDKHPFPLVNSTDSRHCYIALENDYEIKVVPEAIAYELRAPRSTYIDDFKRGIDSYRLGYLFIYLLARTLKTMFFKRITAIFMIFGFLYSMITKKKKYTECKKVLQYQKLRIKMVMLQLLP